MSSRTKRTYNLSERTVHRVRGDAAADDPEFQAEMKAIAEAYRDADAWPKEPSWCVTRSPTSSASTCQRWRTAPPE